MMVQFNITLQLYFDNTVCFAQISSVKYFVRFFVIMLFFLINCKPSRSFLIYGNACKSTQGTCLNRFKGCESIEA